MSRRSHTVPVLLLLAALAGLGWLNLKAHDIRPDISPIVPGAASAPAAGDVRDIAAERPQAPLKPLGAYRETLERPLFSPTRRPAESAPPKRVAEPPRPPPPPKPQAIAVDSIRVAGVLIQDQDRRALMRTGGDAKGAWTREGDSFGGWRLVRIAETGIVIEADGTRHELKLATSTGAAGAPTGSGEPVPAPAR